MASTKYTENLGLCAWSAEDKPKRIDFVNDNNKIDNLLGTHIYDNSIHVTLDEKARFLSPYKITTYAGNGAESRTLSLDEQYSFAIIFQKGYPYSQTDASGNTVLRSAIVGRTFGSNADVTLSANSIVLKQNTTATNSIITKLNENYGQYVMILFK